MRDVLRAFELYPEDLEPWATRCSVSHANLPVVGIADLEDRLATLEAQVGPDGIAPADD